MYDTIKWYQSRTIWALLVSVVAFAIQGFVQIPSEEQGHIVDAVLSIIGALSSVAGIYYRVKADQKIR